MAETQAGNALRSHAVWSRSRHGAECGHGAAASRIDKVIATSRSVTVNDPGVLYVVATPIGNFDDISMRAVAVLGRVALVAAEDTRHTGQLLAHLGLQVRQLALHEHNEAARVDEVLAHLAAGESVALVSDAGTPLISDPGFRLVAAARERGCTVTPIPGACAAIAALSASGLPTNRFRFEGFLPARAGARRARLADLQACPDTLVFYEAVHRVGEMLADLALAFGDERQACVARELTKLHETFYWGSLGEIRARLAADPGGGRGEFTIVVAGAPAATADDAELRRIVRLLMEELPAAQAARLAARITGGSRREAYALALGEPPRAES